MRLVYEDQGDPFTLKPGELVLQPPGIRHRVLETSPEGLEVIEVGIPGDYMTRFDYNIQLPTGEHLPKRDFDGQTFVHHLGLSSLSLSLSLSLSPPPLMSFPLIRARRKNGIFSLALFCSGRKNKKRWRCHQNGGREQTIPRNTVPWISLSLSLCQWCNTHNPSFNFFLLSLSPSRTPATPTTTPQRTKHTTTTTNTV